MSSLLLIGAGRMGGALLSGWRAAGAAPDEEILVVDPEPGAEARGAPGVRLNPDSAALGGARRVLLAVKPQLWREAAAAVRPHLSADAVVVSIAAGVPVGDLEAVFQRPVARVMPTTAVAIAKGAATLFSRDARARIAALELFSPVAEVVEVDREDLVDVATAVSGSAPAYLYLLIEALEAAGRTAGLPPEAAAALVRSTMVGAAALLEAGSEEPAELRRQVTSKGGTTEAALRVLGRPGGLVDLIAEAVAAAQARARELAA